tara:strand:+ start:2123 stop:3307 length:1185 start_codon:yes stop_codon:yes gene_type:complete
MIHTYKISFLSLLLLFVSGCSFMVSRVLPIKDIQSPTGMYGVGTKVFYWIDKDREEWFSEDINDNRELMVQVWYPSNISTADTDPWLDNPKLREDAIIDNFKVPKFIAKAVDRIDTDSYIDSSPLIEGSFPVIIFSHGFEGFRSQNTTQIQELVSNGYIVFAADHTYDAVVTIFPDGRKIPTAKKYCRDCEPEEFYEVFTPQINTRIADIRFIIDQIERIKSGEIESNFSHMMNDDIGVFGHSFGGGTSLAATILDSRIKSCLSLDGWYAPVHPDVYNRGISTPFLHLGQVEWSTDINYNILDEILESKSEDIAYKLTLDGAHHYDFTDSPHLSNLSSSLKLSSDLDSEEILDVTNTTVLGFFDEHLKLKETDWIQNLKNNVNTKIEEFNSIEK